MEFEQELQKLNDFYNDGYLVQDEYERRVKEIYDRFGIGHDVEQLSQSLGQLSTSDAAADNKSNKESLSYESLNKIVVVYLFDGSAKYTPMLQRSIRSLMTLSPDVYVGLLNLNTAESQISDFIRSLPNPHMVRVRDVTVHFPNWNPTQHKLDIIKFTDEFETVVWLDSDTVLMKDFRPFLLKFHHSKQQYALIKDRVNFYDEFKNRWCGRKDFVFVPQACLMGFKRDSIKTLFDLWEVLWFEWITPAPFTKFPDPYPSFHASAFCIEQYALGMALEKLLADSNNFADVVYEIPRRDVVVLSYNWKFSDVVKKILDKIYMFGEPAANASPESRAVKTLGQILAARTGKPEHVNAALSSASTLLAIGTSSASYGYSSAVTAASSASYGYSSASYGGYSSAVSSASYGPYSSATYGEYSSASTTSYSSASYGNYSSASYGGYSSAVSSASYGPYSSAVYGSSGSLLSSAALSSASSALLFSSSGSSFANLESGLLYDIVVDSFEDDTVLHYYSVNYTKFNTYED